MTSRVLRIGAAVVSVLVVAGALGLYAVNRHLRVSPQDQGTMARATVVVGAHGLDVAVARTDDERGRGLSGVADVPADGGMLFDAGAPTDSRIWMLGMNVPLDIVWIDGGRVVHVVAGAQPEAILHSIFGPPTAARYVLEVAAGTAERIGLRVGTDVVIREQPAPSG